MLKLGTTMSLSSGTYTIASGHQMNSQQIMQMTQNNGNNINLIDLGKKLLDACKNGETEEVRNLMQSGAPFTTDWLGTSPLHFAAQYGHAETAELLLRAGVSRDTRTKVDRTPLHAAAQDGHLMIVSLLLLHGADVDAKDLLKMTPLHWAVERGHTDVVECLLTNGADVNLMSKFDKTPIDIALDTGRLDLVPLLQKYVNVSRPKPEVKQVVAPSSKLRPTVLPNKANRTTKTVKSTAPPPQQTNNVKQVFLPSNLSSLPKTVNLESLKKVLSSGNTSHSNESSSSNVFAALAALAEATSGNSSTSISNEALQGLLAANAGDSENNDTLCQSALESGRQFSVTDGGKLALSSYAKEKNPSTTSSNSATSNSKIITIVAESSQLPHIISSTQATPIVLVSSSSLSDGVESHKRKQIKVTRPVNLPTRPQTTIQTLNKQINLTTVKDPVQDQVSKLQKELELMKKQAEEYKLQLKEKEKENSSLRQQLDAIKADSRQKSD